jgi:uncharacterized protein with HEPN domain
MPRDARALLYDILNAAAAIDKALTGTTLAAYRGDPDTQSIVERHFITLGEALRRIETLDPEAFAEIPAARRIVDFRNVLVHAYDAVDHEVVWEAARVKLPALRRAASAILDRKNATGN